MDQNQNSTGSVAVIGAGTMGAGIAHLSAAGGYRTLLIDTTEATATQGRQRVADFLAESVRRGKVTPEERETILSAIETTTDLDAVSNVDFIVEAVVEDPDVKGKVLGDLSKRAANAVIATNTSAIPIAALAANVENPSRFAGLHFFNPPQLMRLVEIVAAIHTTEETTERLRSFVDQLGKKGVVVRDRPGFLVNNLLMPYLNQAIREFDAGLATADDLDTAVELGLGYPMGPLKLLDLIGLDVHLHATQAAYNETYEERFAPPALLRRKVAAGQHGTKAGHGFRTDQEES